MVRVFRRLYNERYPIRQMRLVDHFGADDMRSMRADNTSAFNCRWRAGICCTWSQHAYGRALDLNPVENPYVFDGGFSPPNGAPVPRSVAAPAGHGPSPRHGVVGVPRGGLGMGRQLVGREGLPALLRERQLVRRRLRRPRSPALSRTTRTGRGRGRPRGRRPGATRSDRAAPWHHPWIPRSRSRRRSARRPACRSDDRCALYT